MNEQAEYLSISLNYTKKVVAEGCIPLCDSAIEFDYKGVTPEKIRAAFQGRVADVTLEYMTERWQTIERRIKSRGGTILVGPGELQATTVGPGGYPAILRICL